MSRTATLGVDIGTSSSKGVLTDTATGEVLATAVVEHAVQRPREGHVEMDPEVWWDEFVHLTKELLASETQAKIIAIGVSGMGPCVALTDRAGQPVRPAILYGVDTRATAQITRLSAELGAEIAEVCGSRLTSQAAGPKVAWVREEEPTVYARARRLFMPASFLAHRLTGAYVLDHQSASQCTPLYDINEHTWREPWWELIAPGIEKPTLAWAGDIAGHITKDAASATGLPTGLPVIAGTIDAWTEAVSVDAHRDGDLMLMYGTTMFLVATGAKVIRTPSMWTTVGAFEGTHNLAGGLATSGALTAWIKDLTGSDYSTLLHEAEQSPAGSNGLLMLPYFAGERTPILDPNARGVIAGLTLAHTRGDLYRAALEATAFGVRHNIETMRMAGAKISRVVAVGGGARGKLWLQIVSDVTDLPQVIPATLVGASYGAAFLAARAVHAAPDSISEWNPAVDLITPRSQYSRFYDDLFVQYTDLYRLTKPVVHNLANHQTSEGASQ